MQRVSTLSRTGDQEGLMEPPADHMGREAWHRNQIKHPGYFFKIKGKY